MRKNRAGEPIARIEANLEPIFGVPKAKAKYDILLIEIGQAQGTNVFHLEGDMNVLLQNVVAPFIDPASHFPSVDSESGSTAPIQCQTYDFRIMKVGPVAEPSEKIACARDGFKKLFH